MNCTTPPVNNWYNKYRNIHRGDFVQQFEEVRLILEKAKKITVLTGAGASTESGIPDFRSANGLYADANVEMYLSRGYYNRSPKEFWKHYKEIFQINTFHQYKPNRGHRF